MYFRTLFACLLASTAMAALNEPCYGLDDVAGVCIDAGTCLSKGGSVSEGGCSRGVANVKCCSKSACDISGNCRWSSDCPGGFAANQCPGPAGFKCCYSPEVGFGGYLIPRIPAVGACKANAVAGAQTIVRAWPGRIREVQCIGNGCACVPSDSKTDHCCGLATDIFVSDAPMVPSLSGKEIAEWAMNNAVSMKVKYVIWGQRIWNAGTPKPWSAWSFMEDRGNVQANHWDHVHVSYKA